MRATRTSLILLGTAIVAFGAFELQQTQTVRQIGGLVLWLFLALVVHDAIIAPAVLGVSILLRKYGRRIPLSVLMTLQAGVVVGLIASFPVVLEIAAKSRGPANPTVLPFDYDHRLGWLWIGTAILTAVAVTVLLLVRHARIIVRRRSVIRR